jgi:hypothetical protein
VAIDARRAPARRPARRSAATCAPSTRLPHIRRALRRLGGADRRDGSLQRRLVACTCSRRTPSRIRATIRTRSCRARSSRFDLDAAGNVTGRDVLYRTTDDTAIVACDDVAASTGGLAYLPEFHNVPGHGRMPARRTRFARRREQGHRRSRAP